MPIGTTSYLSRSMAPRKSPALAHDTACSALRPPNTTATRTLRCVPMHHLHCSSQSEDGSPWPAWKCLPRCYTPGLLAPDPPPPWCAAERLEGYVGVADQVLDVFQADGEADRAGVDAGCAEGAVVE